MTELDALLTAILSEPGEDLPRLVFADWLDDHADALPDPEAARAEFIRCQIELAKVNPRDCNQSTCNQAGYGPCRHCRDVEDLRRRERSLFQSNAIGRFFPESLDMTISLTQAATEAAEVGGEFVVVTRPTALLRRGFPEKVWLPSLADWERWGKEIASAAPVTEMVVADRVPHEEAGRFLWQDAGGGVCPLPRRVFGRLWKSAPFAGRNRVTRTRHVWFPDRDSALLAAARAFADEARARASLPPVWTSEWTPEKAHV